MKKYKISDLCNIKLGYSFRKGVPFVFDGEVSVIQPRNIINNDFSDMLKISNESAKPKHLLNKDDILLVNKLNIKSIVFDGNIKAVASSGIFVLSVKSDKVLPYYLSIYLNSVSRKYFNRRVSKTTIEFINLKDICDLELTVPLISKQEKICKLFSLYEKEVDLLNQSINLKSKLINEVLKGVLNGQY